MDSNHRRQWVEDFCVTRVSRIVKHGLIINTQTRYRSIAFFCLVFLGSTSALHWIYRHFQADLLVAKEQTIESYTRAIAYSANNAELWWVRGRLHHYGFERNNLTAAVQDYRRALSLNPRIGQAWIDLADCLEREGNPAGAEESFQNALKVWTYSPIVHWQAGNYYLTHGNLEKMYRHFRTAIDYDTSKLDIALRVSYQVEPDPSRILSRLVPDKMATNLNALAFFIAHDEMTIAGIAWARLIRNHLPEKPLMDLSVAFPYIDALLSKNRIEDAYRVWLESREKFTPQRGTVRPETQLRTDSMPNPAKNIVWNGSFEDEILDGGFDWRQQKTDGADIQIDSALHEEGSKSLRVTFHGVNIHFSHLSQILPISKAGNYQFQYYLKTENLTTDQRPYFTIESFPVPQDTLLQTDAFPSLSAWEKHSYSFKVNPGTKAIKLSLRRSPSERFDSQITGSLWLDNVAIDVEKPPFAQEKKSTHDSFQN
jgi:tetratricopeptide (TPR) repeat protein